MKKIIRRSSMLWVIALMLIVPSAKALACPSCFGDPNSAQTEGLKWAVVSLLGITATVLMGVGAFIIYLRKKTLAFNRRFSDSLN